MTDRREFLKKMAIGGASALVVPSLLSSCHPDEVGKAEDGILDTSAGGLIVPRNNGLRIIRTGERRNGIRILPI